MIWVDTLRLFDEPIHIEDVDFHDNVIKNSNLSGVRIEKCVINGLTINGIPVEQLIVAYDQIHGSKQ
ncbi:hypothetical protein [Paenibacillus terrigena]|uniref:hypothetical protein n=1 Tax=Paenibacillus terrigena TaxID=369333 RepID=UPI0028D0D17C|nr:hypothetical protein [Paenibacillus terrigena]